MITDKLRRPLGSLRVSVTDRCNLRCRYCMPEEEYVWLPKRSILTFEEIARLVGIFTALGVDKVRLTGGEPLLRHDLPTLTAMLARNRGVRDLALTTNGVLLAKHAAVWAESRSAWIRCSRTGCASWPARTGTPTWSRASWPPELPVSL